MSARKRLIVLMRRTGGIEVYPYRHNSTKSVLNSYDVYCYSDP